MNVVKHNKIAGYRAMLGLNQTQVAKCLGISVQSYNAKENGKRQFKDNEKIILLELFQQVEPTLTIDSLFF